MIKKALISDIDEIVTITKKCAEHMISQGIFQWNEHYPSKSILLKDIELNQLWKLELKNELVGIIVLTEIEDIEYKNVQWKTKNGKNLYIHRLAIHPQFQGQGFAQELMNFAEDYAIKNKYKSIRLDTFSKNKRNQKFYIKRGYQKLDSIYFPNQSTFPFYCFELILNV